MVYDAGMVNWIVTTYQQWSVVPDEEPLGEVVHHSISSEESAVEAAHEGLCHGLQNPVCNPAEYRSEFWTYVVNQSTGERAHVVKLVVESQPLSTETSGVPVPGTLPKSS